MQQLSIGQTYPEVIVNENFDTVSHVAVYGKNPATTAGLVWGYYGGRWGGFAITAATLALTASSTNYVVVAKATGVISVSTAATNWNDGTNYARVFKVVTGASAVTLEEDHRAGPGGVHGGGSGGVGSGSGAASGLEYTASSTTTDSDPGTGILRWNNATQASATSLFIDNAEADGASVSALWALLAVGTLLKITKADDPDTWQIWRVNSAPVNGTGYYKFPVTLVAQEGSDIGTGVSILLDVDSSAVGAVTSVAGRTGAVTLTIADIGSSLDIRNVSGMALANDGTTDDAAVFAAALASGAKYISARGLNVAILTQVNLVAGVTLDITGSTITTPGSTLTTFRADSIDDWHLVANGATILGAGSTVGSAKAIHVTQCNRYSVTGLRAKNIKGHGFYLTPGTLSTPRGDQGVFTNCLAESCYWGWEDTPGTGAEYTVLNNFRTSGCATWGVKTSAGNIQWTGGQDVDNVGDGFVVVAGANHAHGIVTGRSINHNGTNNLSCTGIVNGESFVGCHLYEKTILLDGCKGVTFTGGAIDCPTITVNSGASSGKCLMLGVFFPGDYGVPAIGGTDTNSLLRKNNYGAGNPGNTDIYYASKSANYTFVADDEGVLHPTADTTARDLTVPANASVPYPIGKVLSGINQTAAGIWTLKCTSDSVEWGALTGDRAIAPGSAFALQKIAATKWMLTGTGIT